MALGVLFSLAVGIGLMALIFYSSRKRAAAFGCSRKWSGCAVKNRRAESNRIARGVPDAEV
jgi:hypothetical protein